MRALLAILGFVTLFGCATPTVSSPDLEFIRDVTYRIYSEGASCSATAIGRNTLLTAKHCLFAEEFKVEDRFNISRGTCKADRISEISDVATLTCTYNFPKAALVASDDPVVDQPVWVVGYPLAMPQIVTVGFWQGYKDVEGTLFQVATAQVAPGNSGGGMFIYNNGSWYVAGVTSWVPVVAVGMGGSLVYHLAGFVLLEDIVDLIHS